MPRSASFMSIWCVLCQNGNAPNTRRKGGLKTAKQGIFYGIGVGPGDPDLLTLKAVRALQDTDVIIAPRTEKKEGSVALSIAKPHLKPGARIVYQVFPMVRDFAADDSAWQQNKKEILDLLRVGNNVAFLTLGDAMFYSTYIYIFRLLQKEAVDIRTIPGIPAYVAIAAEEGYPLADGNDIVTIIPATAPREKREAALDVSDRTVLMKVYRNFPEIVDELQAHGMTREALLVSRSGLDGHEVSRDLMSERSRKHNYLSTILTRKDSGAEAPERKR